jgi:hypothetical protein
MANLNVGSPFGTPFPPTDTVTNPPVPAAPPEPGGAMPRPQRFLKLIFQNLVSPDDQELCASFVELADVYDVESHTLRLGGYALIRERLLAMAGKDLFDSLPRESYTEEQRQNYMVHTPSVCMSFANGSIRSDGSECKHLFRIVPIALEV